MNDPQWKRALELYDSLGNLPPDAARAFLDSSVEDPVVVHEVAAMLGSLCETQSDVPAVPEAPQPQYAGGSIGRYDILNLVGRGSTGDVYAGHDRELARPVALKFMSLEFAASAVAAESFVREARAASSLNHPNIVTVHEVISWKSMPVIVMEFVEGELLRSLCGSPLPLSRVILIGSQVMQALAFAHSAGVVHRDLKPENVIVRSDGIVKILDLGLARRTIVESARQNISSTAGLPVGTLRYMSPEQCRGEAATPASDVFAAGIVLYEMIVSRHPFHADSPLDTAHAIVWSPPPPLSQERSDLPLSIEPLIMRMLAKDAQARPSAPAVAEALAAAGNDKPQPVVPRASLRSHLGSLAVGSAAAIILIGGLWYSWASRRINSSSELQISPLASWLGAERQPSISADGNRVAIAFREAKDPTSHIYIKNVSNTGSMRLTSGALPDFYPVFSPDGSRVAFLRQAGGRLRAMVTPSVGGIEHQIGEIADIRREYAIMTWDPEGHNLLLADRVSESRQEVAIFQISVETSARRQITFPPAGASDWMPAISPDGRRLGYARVVENGRGDIWAMPVQGGPSQRLTHTNEVFFCWTWANDGEDLLISYRRSERTYLWRQPIAGGKATRVAGLDDQVKELSVARKENRLVYGSSTEDDYNIWKFSLPPSTAPPKPLIASAAFDGDARYSPDGARIAFASTRSGQSNIWICSSDGSDLRQVTSMEHAGFTAGSPSWSPDGRWIAFDSRSAESASSIFLLDTLGGKPKRLTGPGPTDIIPTWSRDGHFVYFSSDRGGGPLQIWKAPAAGGTPVQVTRDAGLESFESPDGRYLYYTKRGRKAGIWRMLLGGGDETYVPELAMVANRYWQNSSQGIFFVPPSQAPALELFHFSDGQVSQVMSLPVQPAPVGRGLSISPDGRSILYMQADVSTSNVMVVGNFH
jgi:eukaryotic-like serine/threonine-protein kinase